MTHYLKEGAKSNIWEKGQTMVTPLMLLLLVHHDTEGEGQHCCCPSPELSASACCRYNNMVGLMRIENLFIYLSFQKFPATEVTATSGSRINASSMTQTQYVNTVLRGSNTFMALSNMSTSYRHSISMFALQLQSKN